MTIGGSLIVALILFAFFVVQLIVDFVHPVYRRSLRFGWVMGGTVGLSTLFALIPLGYAYWMAS